MECFWIGWITCDPFRVSYILEECLGILENVLELSKFMYRLFFPGFTCRVYLQKQIYEIGPIQVVGFLCLVQLRLRIRRPLKISYRSLYCVVLFNGENTSNYITVTFASSCLFCINSNFSLAPCWIFQIFFWILDTLNDFTDVTLACDDSFNELRISNPYDLRSFFKDP